MIKFLDFIKRIFLFYKDHYLFLSSAVIFVFTTLCYLHTDKYFSEFHVDFLIFGGFADVYQVALSNGVLGITLSTPVFLYLVTIIWVFFEYEVESRTFAFLKFFLLSMSLFALYAAVDSILLSGPTYDAEEAKSGFSARFNLNVDSSEIRCQTIIGSTKDYVITWDHKILGVRAIPRSSIIQIEMAIGAPPARYFFPVDEEDEQYATYKTHLEDQTKWSSLLMLKCNEEVAWPKVPAFPPQAK